MDKFSALSDHNRRKIVETLGQGSLSTGELVQLFNISQPAISQHLKILKSVGLVVCVKDAQRRIYSLDVNGLDEIELWLQKVRQFWNPRLDKLEKELEMFQDNQGDKL